MEESDSVHTEGDNEEHLSVGSELMEWAEIKKWNEALEKEKAANGPS